MNAFRIIEGDCVAHLAALDAASVQTCVTSPPYWGLRDYGTDAQFGLEPTPEQYVANLVAVFHAVRRVLRDDGTLWLNLGDSYAGSWGAQGRSPQGSHAIDCDMDEDCLCSLGGMSAGQIRAHPRKASRTGSIPTGSDLKPKDLVGIPWMVAFALRADGWYLRSDVIWNKPNPMPESVTDRPTKAHEYLFLLTKSQRYFYDATAIREDFADDRMGDPGQYRKTAAPDRSGFNMDRADLGFVGAGGGWSKGAENGGRNKRSVWTVSTKPFPGAHFATFPPDLIEPCILAGSSVGDTILDPFSGAGTTGLVALRHDRNFIGIELNPEYAQMARDRIVDDAPLLNAEAAA